MSTERTSKLNKLLSTQPSGVVLCSSWLKEQGYSLDLQKRYKKSQWFESAGTGALVRHGDEVDYLGGLYALQTQLGMTVHTGGRAALSMKGKSQYLELAAKHVQLFGGQRETLPLWFRNRDWGVRVNYKSTHFLPPELGLVDYEHKGFTVKISSPARALMECLYLAPKDQSLVEAYELMEGLNNLRPPVVQKLLEACTSVKVKRLFLYMAERANHDWFNYLDLDKVDLGVGKRSIVKEGMYNGKYQITLPKEFETTL